MVNKRSFADHESVVANITKPATIMSGPRRLVGRCCQARSPPNTYETVIQSASRAITSGSPSSRPIASFVSARTSEMVASTQPARAIDQIAIRSGF